MSGLKFHRGRRFSSLTCFLLLFFFTLGFLLCYEKTSLASSDNRLKSSPYGTRLGSLDDDDKIVATPASSSFPIGEEEEIVERSKKKKEEGNNTIENGPKRWRASSLFPVSEDYEENTRWNIFSENDEVIAAHRDVFLKALAKDRANMEKEEEKQQAHSFPSSSSTFLDQCKNDFRFFSEIWKEKLGSSYGLYTLDGNRTNYYKNAVDLGIFSSPVLFSHSGKEEKEEKGIIFRTLGQMRYNPSGKVRRAGNGGDGEEDQYLEPDGSLPLPFHFRASHFYELLHPSSSSSSSSSISDSLSRMYMGEWRILPSPPGGKEKGRQSGDCALRPTTTTTVTETATTARARPLPSCDERGEGKKNEDEEVPRTTTTTAVGGEEEADLDGEKKKQEENHNTNTHSISSVEDMSNWIFEKKWPSLLSVDERGFRFLQDEMNVFDHHYHPNNNSHEEEGDHSPPPPSPCPLEFLIVFYDDWNVEVDGVLDAVEALSKQLELFDFSSSFSSSSSSSPTALLFDNNPKNATSVSYRLDVKSLLESSAYFSHSRAAASFPSPSSSVPLPPPPPPPPPDLVVPAQAGAFAKLWKTYNTLTSFSSSFSPTGRKTIEEDEGKKKRQDKEEEEEQEEEEEDVRHVSSGEFLDVEDGEEHDGTASSFPSRPPPPRTTAAAIPSSSVPSHSQGNAHEAWSTEIQRRRRRTSRNRVRMRETEKAPLGAAILPSSFVGCRHHHQVEFENILQMVLAAPLHIFSPTFDVFPQVRSHPQSPSIFFVERVSEKRRNGEGEGGEEDEEEQEELGKGEVKEEGEGRRRDDEWDPPALTTLTTSSSSSGGRGRRRGNEKMMDDRSGEVHSSSRPLHLPPPSPSPPPRLLFTPLTYSTALTRKYNARGGSGGPPASSFARRRTRERARRTTRMIMAGERGDGEGEGSSAFSFSSSSSPASSPFPSEVNELEQFILRYSRSSLVVRSEEVVRQRLLRDFRVPVAILTPPRGLCLAERASRWKKNWNREEKKGVDEGVNAHAQDAPVPPPPPPSRSSLSPGIVQWYEESLYAYVRSLRRLLPTFIYAQEADVLSSPPPRDDYTAPMGEADEAINDVCGKAPFWLADRSFGKGWRGGGDNRRPRGRKRGGRITPSAQTDPEAKVEEGETISDKDDEDERLVQSIHPPIKVEDFDTLVGEGLDQHRIPLSSLTFPSMATEEGKRRNKEKDDFEDRQDEDNEESEEEADYSFDWTLTILTAMGRPSAPPPTSPSTSPPSSRTQNSTSNGSPLASSSSCRLSNVAPFLCASAARHASSPSLHYSSTFSSFSCFVFSSSYVSSSSLSSSVLPSMPLLNSPWCTASSAAAFSEKITSLNTEEETEEREVHAAKDHGGGRGKQRGRGRKGYPLFLKQDVLFPSILPRQRQRGRSGSRVGIETTPKRGDVWNPRTHRRPTVDAAGSARAPPPGLRVMSNANADEEGKEITPEDFLLDPFSFAPFGAGLVDVVRDILLQWPVLPVGGDNNNQNHHHNHGAGSGGGIGTSLEEVVEQLFHPVSKLFPLFSSSSSSSNSSSVLRRKEKKDEGSRREEETISRRDSEWGIPSHSSLLSHSSSRPPVWYPFAAEEIVLVHRPSSRSSPFASASPALRAGDGPERWKQAAPLHTSSLLDENVTSPSLPEQHQQEEKQQQGEEVKRRISPSPLPLGDVWEERTCEFATIRLAAWELQAQQLQEEPPSSSSSPPHHYFSSFLPSHYRLEHPPRRFVYLRDDAVELHGELKFAADPAESFTSFSSFCNPTSPLSSSPLPTASTSASRAALPPPPVSIPDFCQVYCITREGKLLARKHAADDEEERKKMKKTRTAEEMSNTANSPVLEVQDGGIPAGDSSSKEGKGESTSPPPPLPTGRAFPPIWRSVSSSRPRLSRFPPLVLPSPPLLLHALRELEQHILRAVPNMSDCSHTQHRLPHELASTLGARRCTYQRVAQALNPSTTEPEKGNEVGRTTTTAARRRREEKRRRRFQAAHGEGRAAAAGGGGLVVGLGGGLERPTSLPLSSSWKEEEQRAIRTSAFREDIPSASIYAFFPLQEGKEGGTRERNSPSSSSSSPPRPSPSPPRDASVNSISPSSSFLSPAPWFLWIPQGMRTPLLVYDLSSASSSPSTTRASIQTNQHRRHHPHTGGSPEATTTTTTSRTITTQLILLYDSTCGLSSHFRKALELLSECFPFSSSLWSPAPPQEEDKAEGQYRKENQDDDAEEKEDEEEATISTTDGTPGTTDHHHHHHYFVFMDLLQVSHSASWQEGLTSLFQYHSPPPQRKPEKEEKVFSSASSMSRSTISRKKREKIIWSKIRELLLPSFFAHPSRFYSPILLLVNDSTAVATLPTVSYVEEDRWLESLLDIILLMEPTAMWENSTTSSVEKEKEDNDEDHPARRSSVMKDGKEVMRERTWECLNAKFISEQHRRDQHRLALRDYLHAEKKKKTAP